MRIDRRLFAHFDWNLFGITMLLPFLGLVVLYSAGYDPDVNHQLFSWLPISVQSLTFARQVGNLGLGLLAMFVALSIPPQIWHRFAYAIYAACIALLIGVVLFGVVSNGARRWLAIGGLVLQPAEVTKMGVILILARYLSKRPPPPGGYGFRQLIVPLLIIGLPMGLIIRQPDLGTALVVGGVGMMMLLFVGIRPKVLLIAASVVMLAAYPVWHVLHPYQQRRVIALIDPDADPLGSGYHIIQSKIAVGSGSLFGKGYLQGTQTQLEFLPEHTTDFVFSVLAEEWGFVGCFVVICLYLVFLNRLLRVVQRSRDAFTALLTFGVVSKIFFHAAVNIGMVVGLLPVVGIPLPLFSYGGSSMIATMFSVGLVLGVSMRRLLFAVR